MEQKTKNKKSRILKIVLISLAALVVVGIAAFVIYLNCFGSYDGPMYQSKDEVYAYFEKAPVKSFDFNFSRLNRVVKRMEKANNGDITEADKAAAKATPLDEQTQELVEKGNQILIDIFQEEYGISVAEELDQLKTLNCDLPGNIAGMFEFEGGELYDGKTVYVDMNNLQNSNAFTDWETNFFSTYLHEAIHYLGSASPSDDFLDIYIIEGITESLTSQALLFGGCTEEYIVEAGPYELVTKLGTQLLTMDKELVVLLIDGFGYRAEELEAYIDGKSFEGMYDALAITHTVVGQSMPSKRHQRIAQEVMGEYLKYLEPTQEQMITLADYFIAPISKLNIVT